MTFFFVLNRLSAFLIFVPSVIHILLKHDYRSISYVRLHYGETLVQRARHSGPHKLALVDAGRWRVALSGERLCLSLHRGHLFVFIVRVRIIVVSNDEGWFRRQRILVLHSGAVW